MQTVRGREASKAGHLTHAARQGLACLPAAPRRRRLGVQPPGAGVMLHPPALNPSTRSAMAAHQAGFASLPDDLVVRIFGCLTLQDRCGWLCMPAAGRPVGMCGPWHDGRTLVCCIAVHKASFMAGYAHTPLKVMTALLPCAPAGSPKPPWSAGAGGSCAAAPSWRAAPRSA